MHVTAVTTYAEMYTKNKVIIKQRKETVKLMPMKYEYTMVYKPKKGRTYPSNRCMKSDDHRIKMYRVCMYVIQMVE
jgi:hypothetical protein